MDVYVGGRVTLRTLYMSRKQNFINCKYIKMYGYEKSFLALSTRPGMKYTALEA
jgi:hypothetical protein